MRDKNTIIIRIIAGVFFFIGMLFAFYMLLSLMGGQSAFDVEGLVVSTLCVCGPIAIGTWLLVTSIKKKDRKQRVMYIFTLILSVFYSLILVSLLFYHGSRQMQVVEATSIDEYFKWNANVIPFKTIVGYLKCYLDNSLNKSTIMYNIFGNILLFAPMGILLPSLFKRCRKFYIHVMTMFIMLVIVEFVQLLTQCGSFDIDDVILNLLGAIVFWWGWNSKKIQKILKRIYVLE